MFNYDCFAFKTKESKNFGLIPFCEALTNINCDNCNFYQSKDEYLKKCEMLEKRRNKKI